MAIQCHEFERAWNELLDSGTADAAHRERALLEHAAACPTCRQVAERYQGLIRALRAWGPPPTAPPGLADRILAEFEARGPSARPLLRSARRRLPGNRAFLPLAAAGLAACLLVVIGIDRWGSKPPLNVGNEMPAGPGQHTKAGATPAPVIPGSLNVALADATEATWELARLASEPAARISRQMIDAATGPDSGAARGLADGVADADADAVPVSVAVPRLDALAPDSEAAAVLLEHFGADLATGVRPLSSTARHAFGFLLGPAPFKQEVRTKSPAEKGA
jgi:hypothetical protein